MRVGNMNAKSLWTANMNTESMVTELVSPKSMRAEKMNNQQKITINTNPKKSKRKTLKLVG